MLGTTCFVFGTPRNTCFIGASAKRIEHYLSKPGLFEEQTAKTVTDLGNFAIQLGGFHLRDKTQEEVKEAIAQLRKLGVEKAAPTHCTGDNAIALFREAFGDDYIPCGVGKRLSF